MNNDITKLVDHHCHCWKDAIRAPAKHSTFLWSLGGNNGNGGSGNNINLANWSADLVFAAAAAVAAVAAEIAALKMNSTFQSSLLPIKDL